MNQKETLANRGEVAVEIGNPAGHLVLSGSEKIKGGETMLRAVVGHGQVVWIENNAQAKGDGSLNN